MGGADAGHRAGGLVTNFPEKIVVLGADAAGMSAAHQALRTARSFGRELEIVAIERTPYTSYSACGLPYWISGDVESYEDLVARTPEQHQAMGLEMRTGVTAVGLDVNGSMLTVRDFAGVTETLGFDQLVIATGAKPIVPEWAMRADGTLIPGIGAVKDPDDGQRWIELLSASRSPGGRGPVVIVGAGYIGVEMAEAVQSRGWPVVLIARSRVMSGMEPTMSDRIERGLTSAGVEVIRDDSIVEAITDADGTLCGVATAGGLRIDSTLVLVAIGVRPALDFVPAGVLPRGRSGALTPDARGQVAPNIWAAGDCSEVRHRVSSHDVYLPLGTHANKQGKVVGTNLAGGEARFGGVLGTAITRFAHADTLLEISRTGLNVSEARAAGFDPVELTTDGKTASGYMTESAAIATSVVADQRTRRILGAQIIGGKGAAKRIDTIAAALWGELTIDDLAGMDLAYAPPFATVWEAVQLSARRLADRMPPQPTLTLSSQNNP